MKEKIEPEATEEEKRKALNEFIEMTAKGSMTMFKILGLKTHIDAMIIDEESKDEYIFSFRKVGEGPNSWQKKTDELADTCVKLLKENKEIRNAALSEAIGRLNDYSLWTPKEVFTRTEVIEILEGLKIKT